MRWNLILLAMIFGLIGFSMGFAARGLLEAALPQAPWGFIGTCIALITLITIAISYRSITRKGQL